MLSYTDVHPAAVWFALLVLLVVRPISVWIGLLGAPPVSRDQRILISWFGIRGIGSVYYLAYAIAHGIDEDDAYRLGDVALAAICVSIVVHGISVTPLMNRYQRRTERVRVAQ